MVVYISGPITGTDDYMEKFKKAEERLKKKLNEDDKIINPAYINSGLPEGTTHDVYMSISLKLLELADYLILINRWQKSEGCKEEIRYALQHDIQILELPDRKALQYWADSKYKEIIKE